MNTTTAVGPQTVFMSASVMKNAVCGDPRNCAIAIAIKEQTPWLRPSVDRDYIVAWDPSIDRWLLWRVDPKFAAAQDQFDDGDLETDFPPLTLDPVNAVRLVPYYPQGSNPIRITEMDIVEIVKRARLQEKDHESGLRDNLRQSKERSNAGQRKPRRTKPVRTDRQLQRDMDNRRFGSARGRKKPRQNWTDDEKDLLRPYIGLSDSEFNAAKEEVDAKFPNRDWQSIYSKRNGVVRHGRSL